MNQYEMPVGLGMALAMRPEAMEKFAALDEAEKKIIHGTHTIASKEEMQQYVEKIITSY